MAKSTKKKIEAKRKPPQIERPEHGITQLAKEMGIKEASVRVALRKAKIKKTGRFYDFKNASGVRDMAKKLAA